MVCGYLNKSKLILKHHILPKRNKKWKFMFSRGRCVLLSTPSSILYVAPNSHQSSQPNTRFFVRTSVLAHKFELHTPHSVSSLTSSQQLTSLALATMTMYSCIQSMIKKGIPDNETYTSKIRSFNLVFRFSLVYKESFLEFLF